MSGPSLEDSDEDPEHLQFKVILLGDGAVGKTSIANRFTEDTFAQTYKQTIGLDFFLKRIVLPGQARDGTPGALPLSPCQRTCPSLPRRGLAFTAPRRCKWRCRFGTLAPELAVALQFPAAPALLMRRRTWPGLSGAN